MLYFAYGSNMDPHQMRRRCPSSRFVTIARLADHRLAFTRRSPRRRCGVAGVVAEDGAEVWGVVYRLRKTRDIQRLDAAEGYRPHAARGTRYTRHIRLVDAAGDGARPMAAEIYLAAPTRFVLPPSLTYVAHMLRGARHWGLPHDYVTQLNHIPTTGRL